MGVKEKEHGMLVCNIRISLWSSSGTQMAMKSQSKCCL